MKGLTGRTVLVTGGGGAIGRAICRRFAEEGAKVLVGDKDRDAANATATEVDGKALVFDISNYSLGKHVLSGEAIDILVNNAGWDRFQNFADTRPEEWEALIAVNLRGPLNMHRLILPQMLARVGSSGEAVYSACKGGIISFSKTLAREVARKGITVNVVCPGPTDTPILRGFLGEGEADRKSTTPWCAPSR